MHRFTHVLHLLARFFTSRPISYARDIASIQTRGRLRYKPHRIAGRHPLHRYHFGQFTPMRPLYINGERIRLTGRIT